jgi:cytochrome c oxidase cbb3-type subunit I/II
MIRPFRSETERYGEYSKPGEFVYDHPFLWGSKRTGPDLQRVGGKYPDSWHFMHMKDPTSTSPGSIMPAFTWLYTQNLDTSTTEAKIRVMQDLGVPYPQGYDKVANDLKTNGFDADKNKEIIAVIAYLQRLGTDIKASEHKTASTGNSRSGSATTAGMN